MPPHDAPAPGWIERVAAEYGRGRPLALLFDYDGTLTPIVRHPSLARLTPDARHRLARLADLPDVRVGFISGRALAELRILVDQEGVYYAGSGGLEIDLRGTLRRSRQVETANALFAILEDQLLDLLRKFPGTWLERKPGALAMHYRGLLPLSAICFRVEAANLLAAVAELRFRVVSESIEVTPADGWDKGSAVIAILADMEGEFGTPPLPVYCGDAANDAEGMVVVAEAGGVSVGVGADAPAVAQVRLATPAELAAVVDDLTDRLLAARHLPLTARPADSDLATPVVVAARSEPADGLLVVDPDPVGRAALSADLAGLGWRVWQADSAESAAIQMKEHGPAIRAVMVDLQLPGLQGARALSELADGHPDLIRCVMSADLRPYTATAFGRMSDLPLFVKPFPARDLDAALRSMLAVAPTD